MKTFIPHKEKPEKFIFVYEFLLIILFMKIIKLKIVFKKYF